MKKVLIKNFIYLVITTFLLINITTLVLAQQTTTQSTTDYILDVLKTWSIGELSPLVAKIGFTILVFLFIYPIMNMLPFAGLNGKKFSSKIIRFIVAIIVAFLSTAYLTPKDVQLMLISYSSMGMVIGGVVPLILLIFFTMEARRKAEKGSLIVSYLLWIGFIGFIIYKVLSGYTNGKVSDQGGYLAYLIIIAVSLIFLMFQGMIMKFIENQAFETEKTIVENKVKRLNLLQEADMERLKGLEKQEGFD